MAELIQLKRGTKAYWESINPILAHGEVGYELETTSTPTSFWKTKLGDGVTVWNSLPYRGVSSTDTLNLGYFDTELELTTAYPVAIDGNYAVVGFTDTVWVWDTDTTAWVDSGNAEGLIPLNSVGVAELKPEVKDNVLWKSIYDINNNGIVDNSETVNGLTVETAVPLGAVFTDTIYDDTNFLNHLITHPAPTVRDVRNQIAGTYDNYVSWNLKTNAIQRIAVSKDSILDITQGTDISVGYSAGGVVTINNTSPNATHTGEVTGSGALTIASDVIDRDNLAVQQKSREVLTTANINWNLGKEFTKTLIANWVITESNLPTGTDTDCIVLHVTGEFTITPPAYWVHKGGTYDGTKSNMYVVDCLNGTAASEIVNYIIIPDA